ncbi:hypothetical protein [Streptomyces sp. NPDC048669]
MRERASGRHPYMTREASMAVMARSLEPRFKAIGKPGRELE